MGNKVLPLLGAPIPDRPNEALTGERRYTITWEVFPQLIDILITPGADGIGFLKDNTREHRIEYTTHTGLPPVD